MDNAEFLADLRARIGAPWTEEERERLGELGGAELRRSTMFGLPAFGHTGDQKYFIGLVEKILVIRAIKRLST